MGFLKLGKPRGYLPRSTYSQALSQHATTMPDGRRQELENLIKVFLGRDPSLESPGLRPGDLEAARVAGVSADTGNIPTRRLIKSRCCLLRCQRSRRLTCQLGEPPIRSWCDVLQKAGGLQVSVRRRKRVLQQLARDLAVSGAKTAAGGGGEAAHGAGLAPFVQAAEVSGKEILAIVPGPASDVNGGHAWHGENVVARLLEEGGDDALLDLVQRCCLPLWSPFVPRTTAALEAKRRFCCCLQ